MRELPICIFFLGQTDGNLPTAIVNIFEVEWVCVDVIVVGSLRHAIEIPGCVQVLQARRCFAGYLDTWRGRGMAKDGCKSTDNDRLPCEVSLSNPVPLINPTALLCCSVS